MAARRARFFDGMRAARGGEDVGVEGLHAEAHAVHAEGDVRVERVAVERSGVHLHGDLGVGVDPEAVVERGEDAREEVGGHEGGRATAEKDRAERRGSAGDGGGAARGGREGVRSISRHSWST